jgi:enoyl-CoA hydratase
MRSMSLVTTTVDGHVGRVVLDSPGTRNALSDELLDELLASLVSLKGDDDVRVVTISSSHERVFSAGGDLKAFAGDRSASDKFQGLDRFPRLFELLLGLGKPVVCLAGGDVLAGALGLALGCDVVLAKRSVRFGCPEINVGVFPFMISALIFRSVPRLQANELMMLGDLVGADEAKGMGLVTRVFDDATFGAEAEAYVQRLAGKSPLLMKMGKDALASTRDMALPEALQALRSQLALALSTQDVVEGVTAFRDKRDPEWQRR